MIAHLMDLPRKMKAILLEKFKIEDEEKCSDCVEKMLLIHNDNEDLLMRVREILCENLEGQDLLTAQFHMKNLIDKSRYASFGKTYYEYMRSVFNEIITHNIRKGNLIQGREYSFPVQELKHRWFSY